jgi:hypothetical protein
MKRFIILLSIVFSLFSCSSEVHQQEQVETTLDTASFKYHETAHHPAHSEDSTDNPFNGSEFIAAVYENGDLGWCYTIAIDGKNAINQTSIPGIPGKKGFKTEEQALKTANFVIYKLQHNVFPPSVTPKELDSLGVLK